MEEYERIVDAIAREKMIKKSRRAWKIDLIEADEPFVGRPFRPAQSLTAVIPDERSEDPEPGRFSAGRVRAGAAGTVGRAPVLGSPDGAPE